jgi:hypothetical protein
MINWCSLLAFGLIGPIALIPHIAKGHENVELKRGAKDAFILSLYI